MQFKVPQDVQQADRIVAFLTLAQLIICVVGFGFAYAVYTILQRQGLPFVLWFPPVAFIGLLTAAFAFLRIANMPFHRLLIVLLERILTPSQRLWVKGADRVEVDENYVEPEELKAKEAQMKVEAVQSEKEESLKNVGDIADRLDTLKKAQPEKIVEKIDKTENKDVLGKAFETKSEEKTIATPAPATPSAQVAVGGEQVAVKKKRKRRRKKKNIEPPVPMIVEKPPVPAMVEAPAVPMVVEEPPVPMIVEEPAAAPLPQPPQSLSAEDLRKGATITFGPSTINHQP